MSGEEATGEPFGRYRLLRLVGEGGMAEVYLAELEGVAGFRKRLAVKRLLPHHAANQRFVTMLYDEARIAAAIRHPNVAEVLDFGEVGGQHYIAMEFIDGVDLAAVLRTLKSRGGTLPLPAALYVARCVADGLGAAHDLTDAAGRPQEVIHRDVSPHNILVSYEGAVKLIDFGVAKAQNNSTKTRSGIIKGKLQYMSPEQAQAKPVDPRADLFSLGMTLYKMLTGQLPFSGQNEYQIYDQILRKRPAPPSSLVPSLPEVVDALVLKSLRKDRDRRFQTAAEMSRMIDAVLAHVHPGYGALELAAFLGAEVLAPGLVAEPEDGDDFISTVDSLPAPGSGEAGMDDSVIDRLTDREALAEPPAAPAPLPIARPVGPTSAVRPRPVPVSVPVPAAPRPPQPELVPTQALPAAPATAAPATAAARAAFQAAETQPGVVSAPSVHTSQLKGLRPRRRWRYAVAVLLLGAGATAAVLAYQRHEQQPDPAEAGEVAPVRVALSLTDEPDAARVAVIPTAIADAAAVAPPPEPDAEPDAAPPPEPDAAPPPEPDAALPPIAAQPPPPARKPPVRAARGYLTVNALPWAHVEIDGRRLAKHTPIQRQSLKPGRYTITLVSPTGEREQRKVVIEAGKEAKLLHSFR